MKNLLLVAVMSYALFPSTGHAYLDPGSGSLIAQTLLGGAAGLIVLVRLYWRRARDFFKSSKSVDSVESVK